MRTRASRAWTPLQASEPSDGPPPRPAADAGHPRGWRVQTKSAFFVGDRVARLDAEKAPRLPGIEEVQICWISPDRPGKAFRATSHRANPPVPERSPMPSWGHPVLSHSPSALLFVAPPFFFGCARSKQKVPGQGSNPRHSGRPSHCSGDTGGLTNWAQEKTSAWPSSQPVRVIACRCLKTNSLCPSSQGAAWHTAGTPQRRAEGVRKRPNRVPCARPTFSISSPLGGPSWDCVSVWLP